MKIAKVMPIHKSKDKTDMGNYRFIKGSTVVLCKQDTLYENQYGFRPKHSTIDAVAKFTSHVMTSIENKHTTVAVFLDLSKVFDPINLTIMVYEVLPWTGSEITCAIDHSLCHTVALQMS